MPTPINDNRGSLQPGRVGTVTLIVAEEHTAPRLGSGRAPVLGSPAMIALIEAAAVACVEDQLADAQVFAPTLLKFELASVARKKIRTHPADATKILTALSKALDPRRGIAWHDVDATDTVLISHETGLSSYDASYLWLAGWLGADLVTLDRRLANTSTL